MAPYILVIVYDFSEENVAPHLQDKTVQKETLRSSGEALRSTSSCRWVPTFLEKDIIPQSAGWKKL